MDIDNSNNVVARWLNKWSGLDWSDEEGSKSSRKSGYVGGSESNETEKERAKALLQERVGGGGNTQIGPREESCII